MMNLAAFAKVNANSKYREQQESDAGDAPIRHMEEKIRHQLTGNRPGK